MANKRETGCLVPRASLTLIWEGGGKKGGGQHYTKSAHTHTHKTHPQHPILNHGPKDGEWAEEAAGRPEGAWCGDRTHDRGEGKGKGQRAKGGKEKGRSGPGRSACVWLVSLSPLSWLPALALGRRRASQPAQRSACTCCTSLALALA